MKPALIAIILSARAVALTPEQKAVAYLAIEVPRWSAENGCFSCHNNGDSARALYTASRLGYTVPNSALADTRPGFSARKAGQESRQSRLQRQEAGANPVRRRAGRSVRLPRRGPRAPLSRRRRRCSPNQAADGSWVVDGGALGSPATYGTALATYMARRTLE